jgi:hypothetical protein
MLLKNIVTTGGYSLLSSKDIVEVVCVIVSVEI